MRGDHRPGMFDRLHVLLSRVFYLLFDSPDIEYDGSVTPFKFFLLLNERDPGLFYPNEHPVESLRGKSRRASWRFKMEKKGAVNTNRALSVDGPLSEYNEFFDIKDYHPLKSHELQ